MEDRDETANDVISKPEFNNSSKSYESLSNELLQNSHMIFLEYKKKKDSSWYLDNGCSWHMVSERSMFLYLRPHEGLVSFGGNGKGKIKGISKVDKDSLPTINNVLYVEGLKYNLFSISQFCNNGFIKKNDNTILFTSKRNNNFYKINLEDLNKQKVTCLVSKEDERWLWYKKLKQVNLKHILKLYKKGLVKRLPISKNTSSLLSFPKMETMLLHMDLFGPTRTLSLCGKKYVFVIVDVYSRYTRVYFLTHKHKLFNVFEIFYKRTQNEKGVLHFYLKKLKAEKKAKMDKDIEVEEGLLKQTIVESVIELSNEDSLRELEG
ncbi:hypothetical protein CR513_11696, partial [Mucuna pruriens]